MSGGFDSFFKSVIGFAVFIFVSFGVTYVVQSMSAEKEREQQAAAALEAIFIEP